jgi:hypothetical protein
MPPATFRLTAAEIGTEYHLQAAPPPEPGPWPAVAIMDGDDMFAAALDAYRRQRAARMRSCAF